MKHLVGLIAAAAVFGVVSDVWACGGFFCSQQNPVLQDAERIIFVANDDGTVTMTVQVQYSGPSERFSWVVPVLGEPTLGLSSNIAFQNLQQLTEPRFSVNWVLDGSCAFQGVDAGSVSNSDAGAPNGGVTILASGALGPYDYTLIRVDPSLPTRSDVAVAWLRENGYDVTGVAPQLIEPYLQMGLNLIAFRLQKDRMSGDIRPITLTYPGARGQIPIQLTAVAARPDMGVLVWMAGPYQAFPLNYKTLELNTLLLDWANNANNYNAVVSAAADEAGGQGFVTEFAGSTTLVRGSIYPAFNDAIYEELRTADWTENELGFLFSVLNRFGGWDGSSELIATHVPLPEGQTAADLLRCFECVLGDRSGPLPGLPISAILNDLDQNILEPVRATERALVSQPYLTRLYTTMSAEDMTLDPVFDFNPDLSDVSNSHVATRRVTCAAGTFPQDAPYQMELPDGQIVRARGPWPYRVGDMPANRRILQVGLEGSGTVVTDNTQAISQYLAGNGNPNPNPNPNTLVPNRNAGSGCGCSAAETGSGWVVALGLLGLAGWRRRR